jgi:hypothetical protein
VRVDVGHGDLGVHLPQAAHDLRGRQRAAAQVEEVVAHRGGPGAQDVGPDLGDPRGRALEVPCRARRRGQRPGQGVAVDLPGGAGGHVLDHGQARHERGGHALAQEGAGGVRVEGGVGRQVPDQERVAGLRGAHGRRGGGHARQAQQLVVDLAELDAAPAELDLVVGPPREQQPVRVVDHAVPGAVGALPAEGGHGRVLLGVLRGIEVAREPDAADDELAGRALGDRLALRVDDGEVPAVQGEADAHRVGAVELRGAGDDRRLRRPVGVPDLPARGLQASRELRRAGLAAHDQQPHGLERGVRPQRDQGGDGRDDGDGVREQPGADVDPRADQRARRRDQAGAVAPGQPHLLAARVESDREARHHPVARAQRGVLQEQAGLGIDEGGSAAVGDRDALGLPGRARGEDDPGVVRGGGVDDLAGCRGLLGAHARRGEREVVAQHGGHRGLLEDHAGALVGVLGVHGDVGGAREQRAEDRDVQLGRARGDAHAHPRARAHADRGETARDLGGGGVQLGVGEGLEPRVDREGVAVGGDRRAEEVHEGAGCGGAVSGEERGHRGCHSMIVDHRPADPGTDVRDQEPV